MCGIVGYVGPRQADEFLLEGLRRLEYRGYDSAGIATLTSDRRFHIAKTVGRIENLAERISREPLPGSTGIGHTRWATHGVPSEANAHPHCGGMTVEGSGFGVKSSGDRGPRTANSNPKSEIQNPKSPDHSPLATHHSPLLALAHNGVIENYLPLKEKLIAEGYKF